jgi:hypothetical protein
VLLIKRTAARTRTESARFTVLMPTAGPDVALAVDADVAEAAGVLVSRGFTTTEVLAALARANEDGEARLSEVEPLEVELPHPDDVQVASRWPAVNAFRDAYLWAVMAPARERAAAEAEADRWEQAAVRVAPDAAERVCQTAEVWLLRRAREVERRNRWWG